ncbi:MAG: LL-diaminopimelate aminotransferase [Alphaproteobacteria bacterium]|nr:LL-diaminopimelate aminotransferase [Alphaproteobacteria bacterium]
MAFVNENYFKLSPSYLFAEISRRVETYRKEHPEKAASIIRCGIGDVTEPLPQACIKALHKAVDEMAVRETFRGYGPDYGYEFVRHAIAGEYRERGMTIADDEIFLSDGSKCDCANILDILGGGNRILIADPVYPVYNDTNVMAGNSDVSFLEGTDENGFVPPPPGTAADVIYLCFPNNPTGAVATREQLAAWVAYARKNDALILFDAAYEAYIRTAGIPHSIFEIPGASECAIEMRSFSKNGGFTGLRCGFVTIPKTALGKRKNGTLEAFHPLWARRQSTKFNGVSYPVQRAAEALYSEEGRAQVKDLTDFYMRNAKLLREALDKCEWQYIGGVDAPYLWVKCLPGKTSWDMFSFLLENVCIVSTPGSGFGKMGEGYFRLSCFNSRANIEEVCRRLSTLKVA